MSLYISGIPSKDIDKIWFACEPFIEKAANKGQEEMELEHIYKFCKEAKMQLWVIFDENNIIQGAGTTEIINYPAKTVCRLVTLGGNNFDDWMSHIKVIEEWALEKNCKAIETFCRRGFAKKMEKYGYEQTYTVLGKELSSIH